MAFCDPQCLIDRFGEKEIICLSDKNKTCEVDTAYVECMIADAENYILECLAGCGFDIAEIKRKCEEVTEKKNVGLLQLLCANVARYFMYSDIRLEGEEDHESYRRFKWVEKQLAKICKNKCLIINGEQCIAEADCFAVCDSECREWKPCLCCGKGSCECNTGIPIALKPCRDAMKVGSKK